MLTRSQTLLLRASGVGAIGFVCYLGFAVLNWRGGPGRHPAKIQANPSVSAAEETGFRSVRSGSLALSNELLDNMTRLTRLLRRYVRARPLDRGRIVHKIRLRLDDYEGLLMRILHEDHESVLVPACLVAGRLQLHGAPHELYRLSQMGEPEVQAAAIRGLILYDFWTRSLVGALLKRPEPIVLIAALEAAAVVETPPVPEMLDLLVHEDADVRKAVVQAMPVELDPQDLERLRAITATAKGARAHAAIEVLGGIGAGVQRDAALLARLETRSWTIRERCLMALAKGDTPLKYSEPVWRAINRADSGIREKVLAFAVLELRRSVNIARVRRAIDDLHPVVRLQAARCLVSAGDRKGVWVLIGLLETETARGVDGEDVICARDGSARVLREIAGTDLGEDPEAWRRWYRGRRLFEPRRLKSRPRTFW